MIRNKTAIAALAGWAVVALLGLSACKATTSGDDIPAARQVKISPEVHWNVDGYSNYTDGCDGHGFRVFVVFHDNNNYGAITAVPDPTCG